MKAKSSSRVTPGSLSLKLVHSGLYTRMRASASFQISRYDLSSMLGNSIGMLLLSSQANGDRGALPPSVAYEPVADRDVGDSWRRRGRPPP